MVQDALKYEGRCKKDYKASDLFMTHMWQKGKQTFVMLSVFFSRGVLFFHYVNACLVNEKELENVILKVLPQTRFCNSR